MVEDALVEGPIGPHPVSQFEIVFFRPSYHEFLAWLLVSIIVPALTQLSLLLCT